MKKLMLLPLTVLMCGDIDARSHKKRFNPFAQFDEMFEQMENQMEQMRKSFNAVAQHAPKSDINLSIDEQADHIAINIEGLSVANNSFSAHVNEDADVLTVKIDNASAMIHVRDKYISVGLTHRTQKEIEDEDKEGKKYKKMHTSSMSGSTMGRTVAHDVALLDPQPDINYDEETKTLTIRLAFVKPAAKGTSIPVNITPMKLNIDEK